MKALFFLLSTVIFISSYNSKNNKYVIADTIKPEALQEHPGKKLMETNCNICHSPTASEKDRLAPPMIAIKKRYIFKDTTKEEFISDMQNWVKNPNEKEAKMYGAVRRFGVMTKLPYPEETIEQIADYMFDNEIEQPEWFEEHFQKKSRVN